MGTYTRGQYHSSNPRWRQRFNKVGSYVGIELEVEANNGDSYQELLRKVYEVKGRSRPLVESDGSLSSTSGVEFVFPPVKGSTLKKMNSSFGKVLASLQGNVRSDAIWAGMHMSVNKRGWTPEEVALFVAVVNNLQDRQLQYLGDRLPTNYCLPARGYTYEHYYSRCSYHRNAAETSPQGTRIELRFPRNTTDHGRISLLVDFIHELELHVKSASPTVDMEAACTYDSTVVPFLSHLNTSRRGRRVLKVINRGYDGSYYSNQAARSAKRRSKDTEASAGPARVAVPAPEPATDPTTVQVRDQLGQRFWTSTPYSQYRGCYTE